MVFIVHDIYVYDDQNEISFFEAEEFREICEIKYLISTRNFAKEFLWKIGFPAMQILYKGNLLNQIPVIVSDRNNAKA